MSLWRQTSNTVCPNCQGGFVQELEDDSTTSNTSEPHNSQRPRFMEAVTNFLTRIQGNNNWWSSFLVFSGDMPVRLPGNGGLVDFLNESLGFRRDDGGDYFIGPGVEEFFEHITHNDQNLPQPASRSLIDALPTVKISKKHVRGDLTCAVCKEKFELGSRVRKLPCKHLYHSECIEPWLEQRSSCPVCRHVITSQQEERNNGRRRRRRRWYFLLWPFQSKRREERVEQSSVPYYHEDIQYSDYWPFER